MSEKHHSVLCCLQAMIGVAFSLGFTFGPLMGAYIAISSTATENVFYQTPALLASAFSVADLLFIWLMLPETLSKDVKVGLWKSSSAANKNSTRKQKYLRKAGVVFYLQVVLLVPERITESGLV